jgi:hypothetical protein
MTTYSLSALGPDLASVRPMPLLCRLLLIAACGAEAILCAAAPQQPVVADRIRQNKPPLDSPLVQRLRECRIKGVSPTWAGYSFDVDSTGAVPSHDWAGVPGCGTPVQLDENTIAIVQPTQGQKFSVWHIDVPAATIAFKVNVDGAVNADAVGQFESVSWHCINNDIVGEFISLHITKSTAFVGPDRAPRDKFDGESLMTRLNLRTGSVEAVRDAVKKSSSHARCKENLIDNQFDRKTLAELLPPESVTEDMSRKLAVRGQVFDFKRGRFAVTPSAIGELKQAAEAVNVDGRGALPTIERVHTLLRGLPSCAGTRDLSWQLSLAEAVATENSAALDAMIADQRNPDAANDDRRSQMRNLAAFQRLHLIATKGDRIDEYDSFARRCDSGIAARDSAILRTHELRFLDACNQATVAAFDDFVTWAPHAIQAKDAIKHAYDLQEEEVRLAIASKEDPEGIARDLYNDWRTAVRQGHRIKAERSFTLLTDEPTMKKTHTSIQAQDTKDEDAFRTQMLVHAQRNDELLSASIGVQQQQLTVMTGQLLEQSETNAQLGRMGSQLQYIEYSGRRAADGIDALNRRLDQ